ncbi:MAG: histidinol-phosphatase HisJ family protein [Mogibacterium sp.]|nr:histidinol-phosphatase HisJ family protein [Mogibacterium sp.]
MQSFDLHMHTTYCDGNDTAEDMIRAAVGRGLNTVGLSGHSFTPHDTEYCMSRAGTEQYISEVLALKGKYRDRIRVLLGIEMDYYADTDPSPYDYIIGSLHYMFAGQNWSDVDADADTLVNFAGKCFGGEMMPVAELYYDTVADIVRVTDCDIIGHFDLITKFIEKFALNADGSVVRTDGSIPEGAAPLLDTSDPCYVNAWKKAADRIFEDCAARAAAGYVNRLERLGILAAGDKPVFEINTGAIARGYRTTPYPAQDQIDYIKSRGGVLILTSDSHSAGNVGYRFEEFEALL